MPVDNWNNPFFYPTKTNGFFYQQSKDILNDSTLQEAGADNITESNGADGEFTIHFEGPSAIHLARNPEYEDSIGGCDMDFTATRNRGYAYKANDVRDFELKCWLRVLNSADSGDRLAFSGTTGHHTSGPCCQGFNYMVMIDYNSNPVQFQFRKEMWHVSYHDDPKSPVGSNLTIAADKTFTHSSFNFQLVGRSTWTGFAFCRYNKTNGVSSGNDSVILELWGNPDPTSNPANWIKIAQTEDKGGWGDDGDECNGEPDQVGTWSNGRICRIKSNDDDADIEFKHLSAREIDPSKSFDENQNEPPVGQEPTGTSTVKGFFKLQRDINTYRTSSCAGVGGSTAFYTITGDSDVQLSDNATFNNRVSAGEIASNSSSILVGKVIKSLVVPLKKVGTPGASPTIDARIRNSIGTTIYTSPTTIDPTTLTTSYTDQTFDFSTNTHAFVSGDSLRIGYTGTSASNYIIVGFQNSDSITNTAFISFEGGAAVTNTNRELACTMSN